jgi:hypothetical protein
MPQQQGGYNMHPNFGGFINDPAAQLGLSLGKNAVDAGQQYMEQNVCPSSARPLAPCQRMMRHGAPLEQGKVG